MKRRLEATLNRFGWYTLGGRARYCGKPEPQLPPTESEQPE